MTIDSIASPLAAIAIIFAVLAPIWAFWLGMRISRHLYHISVALWQIRDALRAQPADKPVEGLPHIVNSMFGR